MQDRYDNRPNDWITECKQIELQGILTHILNILYNFAIFNRLLHLKRHRHNGQRTRKRKHISEHKWQFI